MATNQIWFGTTGPRDADIVIIGEAWGYEEAQQGKPFVGPTGQILTNILTECRIDRRDVLITNVLPARPPGNELSYYFIPPKEADQEWRGLHPNPEMYNAVLRLHAELRSYPRKCIIPTGNYALWATAPVTGRALGDALADGKKRYVPTGIGNYRGSQLFLDTETTDFKAKTRYEFPTKQNPPLLPIYHPSAIARDWTLRDITKHDLSSRLPLALQGRWSAPKRTVLAPPTFEQARDYLNSLLKRADESTTELLVAEDIETKKGFITCIGFSHSPTFAISIPFVHADFTSYWSVEQEAVLLRLIHAVNSHPRIGIAGQNFIYDTQYIRKFVSVIPRLRWDCMLAQHHMFPGTPLDLGHLSSLYCDHHVYWKDDSKDWNDKENFETNLYYNGEDCFRTYEIAQEQMKLMPKLKLDHLWEDRLDVNSLCLTMMNRGMLVDKGRRARYKGELIDSMNVVAERLLRIIPQEWVPRSKATEKKNTLWFDSPKQQQYVFGEILGMKLPKHRKTGNTTLGKDALKVLPEKYPIWKPLFDLIETYRSLATFDSHFVSAPLDPDGRMRCQFKPAGTETFRLASATNAFGRGTNLQNLPKGTEE